MMTDDFTTFWRALNAWRTEQGMPKARHDEAMSWYRCLAILEEVKGEPLAAARKFGWLQ
jgi:hypothetical protein